ncbi:MAG: hypothetical protein JSS91_14040 [Bacteroidetes bacterium]|nr:hypothetical protein [Bacteroidota bacterium]
MFYRIFNSDKLKAARTALANLLIIAYLTAFNGCVTSSETFYSKPENLRSDYLEDITKIYLKDGSVIENDRNLIYIGKESDTVKYLEINFRNNAESQSGDDQKIINWSSKKIPYNDIKKIEMKNSTVNVPLSILVVGGGIIVLGIIIFAVSGGIDFGKMKIPSPK